MGEAVVELSKSVLDRPFGCRFLVSLSVVVVYLLAGWGPEM